MTNDGAEDLFSYPNRIKALADKIDRAVQRHLKETYSPEDVKVLRSFPVTEVASLLGVSTEFLRKSQVNGTLPKATQIGGRGYYTASEIIEIRHALEASTKKKGKYLPGRRDGDHLQVIQLMNFKGGAGKSTQSLHLSHALALQGYRVLAIDLDPQGSLTSFFALHPENEFEDGVYDVIKYQDPKPISECIRKTYFPNIDLLPATINLTKFDTSSHIETQKVKGESYFNRLSNPLFGIQSHYDVVIIDSPPALSYLTITGLYSATGVIVPLTPSMMDLASTQQFVQSTATFLLEIAGYGIPVNHDFFKFLITRDDAVDGPAQNVSALLRMLAPDNIIAASALRSTAISDSAISKQSIYEASRSEMTSSTYDRARKSMDGVAKEIEKLIQKSWGR